MSSQEKPCSVCFVTASSSEEAGKLAGALVEERLAACVNIIPEIRSLYRWEGKLCDDNESLLVIKTSRERIEQLIERVRELHSYTVPEVIAMPIHAGNADYLKWVHNETRPS